MRNFVREVIVHLELDKLRKSTLALIGFFLVLIISFFFLFIVAVSGKLGEQANYSIVAISETYIYKPDSKNAPSILLNNYKYLSDCFEFGEDWIEEESTLELEEFSTMHLTRFGSSHIRLDVSGKDYEIKAGELDGEDLPECVSFLLKLTEEQSVFTMNLYGGVSIGKIVTDANDAYFPLLLNGEIVIQDSSLITGAAFQHSPIVLKSGDVITVEGQQRPPRGMLRASKEGEAIQGIISVEGGEVYAQGYRATPRKVDISFINKLSDDNELAIALSAMFILAQLTGVIITFLLRLRVINNTSD